MWLYRGAQSAVFYYATCTPCANSIDRRKRKKEAARSQREKERVDAIVTDQPRPFAQPTPFSTNPGWMEEIALGPGPPKRRGGYRSNAQRRTDSWDADAVSCQDLKKDKTSSRNLGDRWNRMLRDQREDEPLWGEDMEVKGSSVGLSGRGRVDKQAPSKYYIPRVPPVNDLHPPIVSGPKSRAETRWMLQPPPSAKVMAGKERCSVSTPPVDYSSLRMDSDRSTSRRTEQNHQLPPLATEPAAGASRPLSAIGSCSSKAPTPESATNDVILPRPPSPTFFAYGKDESHFVISPSLLSPSDSCSSLSSLARSEADSPTVSFRPPATPTSRPVSKSTNDYSQISRPLSKALSTVHRDNKKFHMLHVELADPQDDLELGQIERIRPYRWSMEF